MARLVVALDESELAEEGLSWAALLARALHCSLHLTLVYAYDERAWARAGAAEGATPAALASAAAEYLEDVSRREALVGLTVTTEVRAGNVAEQLLLVAAEGDTQMFVVASHGEGGMKRWARGSVADELVRDATIPVLVVRPGLSPTPARRWWSFARGFQRGLARLQQQPLDALALDQVPL